MNFHIIIPAHNEQNIIENTIKTLTQQYPNCPITVSTDGNTDLTTEIARKTILQHNNLYIMSTPHRLGKGEAIKQALIPNTINAFIDTDLSIKPEYLNPMMQIAKQYNALVIAKRQYKNRKPTRIITSTIYNLIVSTIFHTGILDHQAGLKVLSKKATLIAQQCTSHDYFFDTELIIKCKKAGIPIITYPVSYIETRKSTVNTFKDSIKMLTQVILLKLNQKEKRG